VYGVVKKGEKDIKRLAEGACLFGSFCTHVTSRPHRHQNGVDYLMCRINHELFGKQISPRILGVQIDWDNVI
jgi:hypothetical protein